MKNVNKKIGTFIMAVAMGSLFGSCSKQMTSIGHYNKLDNAQTLDNDKFLTTQKESEILVQTSIPVQASENNPVTLPMDKNIEFNDPPVIKTAYHQSVQILTKRTEKAIVKQTAVIKSLIAPNHSIASISSPKAGGGLLGLAITLLIIGIVLFFLGFGSLGALFWTIGIVLLVIALVFFILWIIGRAVSN